MAKLFTNFRDFDSTESKTDIFYFADFFNIHNRHSQ